MTEQSSRRQARRGAFGHRGPGAMRGTKIDKARDTRAALVRLSRYLRPYGLALVLIGLLIVVTTALDVASPYLLGRGFDSFGNRQEFMRVALLLLASYVVGWLARVLQAWLVARVMQRALMTLRRDLFEHLQQLSLRFFDRYAHGELMSRLTNDIDAISRALGQSITMLISNLLSLVGLLVAMFALNVWLALGSLTVLPLMVLFTFAIAARTRDSFRRLQSEIGQLNAVMEETLSGQRVVQAFARQKQAIEAFDRENTRVRDSSIEALVFALLIPPMMTVLSNADIAVVAGLGGWLALRGTATVGTIVTFITYARRFAQPLRHLADQYNSVQAALAGAERVFEIIDEEPELMDAPEAIALDDVVGHVEYNQVNFAYVPGVPVLTDVTLEARPGQTIALVGPTGAGKTTMVSLLTRFYDIDDGAICIDEHDIRTLQKATLRRQLGIVLQDTYLFAETVMENIRYGRLDASAEECIAAARLANADQFIRRLPEGYETKLSERGSNLSQGQRQLLAIARAVLSDPGILILDEATSSVDTRTEVRIQEALLRLMEGRTSFVIAHRLSTIRKADKLLVINKGRIIERGTHEELLAKQGFYYNLYMSQFKGTKQLVKV
jgi:ATP-binding cassette subfamily B multidrug efflux pump